MLSACLIAILSSFLFTPRHWVSTVVKKGEILLAVSYDQVVYDYKNHVWS